MYTFKVELQRLTTKYFEFLETEFGFVFDRERNSYLLDELEIFISADQVGPIISCWIKSEPNFTKLNFRYFVVCIEKKNLLNTSNLKETYEENFIFSSQLLSKCIRNLINSGAVILVCALKLFYEDSLAATRLSEVELNNTDRSFKLIYEYILLKEIDWVPKPQLIDF